MHSLSFISFIPKDYEDSCIEVVDRIVDTNNGVYKLMEGLDEKPHITIEAGRLAQVLCGYKTLDEQLEENNVVVHDKAFDRLNNLFQKKSVLSLMNIKVLLAIPV